MKSSDTKKPDIRFDSRRDPKDKRLWTTFRCIWENQKIVSETIIAQWKVSRFVISDSIVKEAWEFVKNGGDPSQFNPKLMFFVQGLAYKENQFSFVRTMSRIAGERKRNQEFDKFGDWTKTDEDLFGASGLNNHTT